MEQILEDNDALNKIEDTLSQHGIKDHTHNYNYHYDNRGGVSIVLNINFKTYDSDKVFNESLSADLKKIEKENTVNQISVVFMMGSEKNKVDDKFVNSYELRVVLENVPIDDEIKQKAIQDYVDMCERSLNNMGVLDFVNRYNINTECEFIETIALATNSLNKSAKLDDVDHSVRKKYYSIKDWVIKILIKKDYISDVSKHVINGMNYILFTTTIKNETSYGGFISFHIPESRWHKFESMLKYNLLDMGTIENEYKLRGCVENRELMEDFISVVRSNFVGQSFYDSLNVYLENK